MCFLILTCCEFEFVGNNWTNKMITELEVILKCFSRIQIVLVGFLREKPTRTSNEISWKQPENSKNPLNFQICCFPSLSSKKSNQPLLADEMSVLTTNNSEAFLQNLVEKRNKDCHHYTRENTPSSGTNNSSSTKEEIVLLEKQGRCSQKLRSSNLAQVSNMVKGQNVSDISDISNLSGSGNSISKVSFFTYERCLIPF